MYKRKDISRDLPDCTALQKHILQRDMASVRRFQIFLWLWLGLSLFYFSDGEAKCTGCKVALGSYNVPQNFNTSYILTLFNNEIVFETLKSWNSGIISNEDFINFGYKIRIPFSCDCLGEGDNRYLGHIFQYTVATGDTYETIASNQYANLTTSSWLEKVNSYDQNSIPDGVLVNVSINCSCGDAKISKDYGLFLTYPLTNVTTDNLTALSNTFSIPSNLLAEYNLDADFANASGIAFVPNQDPNGSYLPLDISGSGIGAGTIAGISIGIAFALLFIAIGVFYIYVYKYKKAKKSPPLQMTDKDGYANIQGAMSPYARNTESAALTGTTPQAFTDITVDKSVEFTYQELAESTNDFSIANKIGEGGFGAVYYAELHGERAAIKKMDMQATKEFLAELKVLTHVHHLNLVRLIGFCTEECLFLVYEFIENGNLSQHLRGSGMEPLSWPARVQIALDSARGLEYIHEHTVPVYIHRDIKSANILIDKNFRAKVADFGLTKLTEVGGASAAFPTRLVGTFGYMPPEYAQFGDVSPKVDVYAFGVVLYEIISAKEAIVKIDDVSAESKGLVTLFESILKDPNGRESLRSLIDPRLGNNYLLESVWKMAQLARACTQENPQLRPSMRTVVVALMTLSSSTEDWDVGSFYENQAIVNLMGR